MRSRVRESEHDGQGQVGSPSGRRLAERRRGRPSRADRGGGVRRAQARPADCLRELRTRNSWTQFQVAHRLGSSHCRVAKMEAADASVSLDLLVKSLLALGGSRSEVGRVIAKAA